MEVRTEPVLLQRLAAGIVADVARRFPGARIERDLPADLPPVAAEPGAIRQVLDNLLANAAKYGAGSPITLAAAEVAGHVRMTVVDGGPGLPAGEHDRIFELFYRSPANEKSASGTGIGLFVVRQLVEAMHGTVVAEAAEPRGLRFVIDLPVDPVDVRATEAASPGRSIAIGAGAPAPSSTGRPAARACKRPASAPPVAAPCP